MKRKGTPNIFISVLKEEMESYREKASMVCLNEGLIPNIIKWKDQDLETMGAHAEHRVTQCDLFIGIYGNDYGEKNIIMPNSKEMKDSSIGIEFNSAYKHLGIENMRLYARDLMSREPNLEKIVNAHSCKYVNDEIEFVRDFGKYLSEWNDKRLGRERDSAPVENLRSIDIQCIDKEGLLANIFQSLTTQGWDVTRAKQTLYQREADIKTMVKWKKPGRLPDNKEIEIAIKNGIINCSNKKTSDSAIINIVQTKKEVCEVVKERGRFIIQFYDDQGIAELLFTVFSGENVGILESELEAISEDRPKISRFTIVANLTNVESNIKNKLAKNIRDVSGVIHVVEKREIATWWY